MGSLTVRKRPAAVIQELLDDYRPVACCIGRRGVKRIDGRNTVPREQQLWMAVDVPEEKRGNAHGRSRVIIVAVLEQDGSETTYKVMDEFMHPYYYDISDEVLAACPGNPQTDPIEATVWRDNVKCQRIRKLIDEAESAGHTGEWLKVGGLLANIGGLRSTLVQSKALLDDDEARLATIVREYEAASADGAESSEEEKPC